MVHAEITMNKMEILQCGDFFHKENNLQFYYHNFNTFQSSMQILTVHVQKQKAMQSVKNFIDQFHNSRDMPEATNNH